MDSPCRVVITGAGIVTALGRDYAANAAGFREGRDAFRTVSLFDVRNHRAQTAAEVDLANLEECPSQNAVGKRRLGRASKLLLAAAAEAWKQSGWEADGDIPVVLGTTSGGMSMGEAYYRHALEAPLHHRGQPTRVLQYQVQTQGADLTRALGFDGPMTFIANACASGANAIGHAWEWIRHRNASRVLTGGYDALSELVFTGFDALQALSTTQCRPFDAGRDGLALGEGAAVLALESLEHARGRGAEILGEICGYGAASDSHHITQPHPEGDAAVRTMTEACAAAGVTPARIGYVNAHGTGTALNDAAESLAINRWAGDSAPRLPVSSTKASIGHLLGAAGAVEAVACLMVLREGWLPPMPATREPDSRVGFRLVLKPEDARVEYALTNSFGFGGANASLILRRWP